MSQQLAPEAVLEAEREKEASTRASFEGFGGTNPGDNGDGEQPPTAQTPADDDPRSDRELIKAIMVDLDILKRRFL